MIIKSKKIQKSGDKMSEIKRPIINCRFKIEIDGVEMGFLKATGINSQIEYKEWDVGGGFYPYKYPVSIKHNNITLEKGVSDCDYFYDWIEEIKNKRIVVKKNFQISVLNSEREIVKKWQFTNGYPVSWEITELDAMANSVLVEKISLAYEEMKKVTI